jgi:hypothetical protein
LTRVRLEQAVELARRFHEGATDQAGRPYIEHVLRVADAVQTHDEKLAAVMHDLLEDTVLTGTDLSCAGCPPNVRLAVEALTKAPGEAYEDFLLRAAHNEIALAVKRADINDNADEGRLALLQPELATRLRSKYQRARDLLSVAKAPSREKTAREYEAEFAAIGLPQEPGDAWATFWCTECGRPAGTLTLVPSHAPNLLGRAGPTLVLMSFLGSMSPPVETNEYESVREALDRHDAAAFYKRDSELAPFWCPRCERVYCGSHWMQETFFDDGFFDCIYGTCPQGHRRMLWD